MTITGAALGAWAGGVALGLVWLLERRVGPWGVGRRTLRGLAAVAGALAVAGLTLEAGEARTRVLVLDLSRSLERARADVLAAARAAREDLDPRRDRVGFVLFGRDVVVVPPGAGAEAAPALQAALARAPDPRGSDVGRALRAALEQGGPRAQVVLVSDGRDTGGEALAAAGDLAGAASSSTPGPSAGRRRAGARLARLEAPPRAPPGAARCRSSSRRAPRARSR
ncbi:MAG: VWA domain-containing protein [Planctomycetes bacterium]|nr:VWA domain-containing protein [Planctomycetota bacterium]